MRAAKNLIKPRHFSRSALAMLPFFFFSSTLSFVCSICTIDARTCAAAALLLTFLSSLSRERVRGRDYEFDESTFFTPTTGSTCLLAYFFLALFTIWCVRARYGSERVEIVICAIARGAWMLLLLCLIRDEYLNLRVSYILSRACFFPSASSLFFQPCTNRFDLLNTTDDSRSLLFFLINQG